VQRSIAAGRQFGLSEQAAPTIIGTVPPQHMYGYETTVLLPLHAAASSWCGPAFFPEDVQRACAAVPPARILVTTPLQIRALLAVDADLPGLSAIISATAPLDAALAGKAEARWATRVLEIFGATEVGSIASRRTLDGEAWSLYPGVSLRAEGDRVTALMPLAAAHPLDDEVELLGDRRFRLIGRRTDIVKLGGRRASIAGLNRILLEIDGVEDGTFVLPDSDAGAAIERLTAVVVAPGRDAEGIIGELRRRLDPLFVPRRVVLVASLERNDVGKLSLERVLDMARATTAEAP
jgi:acyl-coenzyme A synthetase/AMP-(fatty) acid ligase